MPKGPILLVEDDQDIQDNLRLFLELEGFSVISAANGQEALDLLRAGSRPSVILLDLMMPVLSGYEFLSKRKTIEFEDFLDIPVLIMSAATGIEKTAKEFGVEFFRKPLELDLLLTAMHKACG